MRVPLSNVRVGRILSEDDRTILLEIHKSDDEVFTLDPEVEDRFLSVLFVRRTDDSSMEVWLPWEPDEEETP